MELPQDIIGYLCRFIKPKRYTLLDKFCRDFYFRKYGLSVSLDIDYPDTDLYNRYRIRMIDWVDIPDDYLESLIDIINFRQKVVRVRCKKYINLSRYLVLRKIFPNLVEFKCVISDYKNITDSPLLDGAVFKTKKLPLVAIPYGTSNLNLEFTYL